MVKNYEDWPDKLPFSLYGYRTSTRTSTKATPYSLVYEIEVVPPIQKAIPSLKVIVERQIL